MHLYLLVLFAWIVAGELGAPVPAIPILVAAGFLSAAGELTLASALFAGVSACLAGDLAWYLIARRRGSEALASLCRVSLNPASCVRRASEFLSRYGARALVVAKFIPGISTMAVPLLASEGTPGGWFFAADVLGSLLFVGTFLLAGRLLGAPILRGLGFSGSLGGVALALAGLSALADVGWRYYRKLQFDREVNLARISPEELLAMLEAQPAPYIVDLRHPLDMLSDPRIVPGAVRMTPGELSERHQEIPRDREIILYCT